MSYTALYRKFRPAVFEDVKGQDHIVTTLKNQIQANRIGHAYLFCGTRGTGKTSVAKIFAKAVNCENPVDGSPCGKCSICEAIAKGSSMNVIEIDAASNNGVDNIREIRNEVEYSPTTGKYKVYIIDEVHMLSMGAFNALLKTLEEPPSYVIFILATTEVHKIPITILSRCQRYDFRRISIETISDRMKELLDTEGQEYEDKAVRYVAKMGDGSMRDALSLLDQCIAFHIGECLTYDKVLEVLGAVDTEVFTQMFGYIIKKDISSLMQMVENIIMQGRELTQFVNEFTWYFRNLLLIQGSDNMEDVLDVSAEQLDSLKESSKLADADTLIRYIRIFSDLSNEMKYASQKRILLEVALIKLCKPQMQQDSSAILERIKQIEERLENGDFNIAAADNATAQNQNIESVQSTQPQTPKIRQDAVPQDLRQVVANWSTVVGQFSPPSSSFLKKCQLSLGTDNTLELIFDDDMAAKWFEDGRRIEELKTVIENTIDKTVQFRIRLNDTGRSKEEMFVDLSKVIQMPIDIEE